MKKKLGIIFFLIVTAITLQGCFMVKMFVRSVDRALFDSTEVVYNKVKNPVKNGEKLVVTWGGHSTMLIQIHNKVILADPFFGNYIYGIFRKRIECGIDFESLQKLDMTIVTHSHADHLNYGSIQMIEDKFPNSKLIFPKGVEKYLPNYNLDMIRINTDNTYKNDGYVGTPVYIDSVKITPVYCLHRGGRYGFDTYSWNIQGYGSFIIEYMGITIYLAGDTAYDENAFKRIGEKFNIDLAIIPIGPCRNCEGKGNYYHTSTIEGLRLFRDIKAKYMIPYHFGSLEYFNDAYHPLDVLKQIIERNKESEPDLQSRIIILKEGQQKIF